MYCREANTVALAKPILLCADHTLHTSLMQRVVVILKRGGKKEQKKKKTSEGVKR